MRKGLPLLKLALAIALGVAAFAYVVLTVGDPTAIERAAVERSDAGQPVGPDLWPPKDPATTRPATQPAD
jgi:hypothetical protein